MEALAETEHLVEAQRIAQSQALARAGVSDEAQVQARFAQMLAYLSHARQNLVLAQ